MNILFLSHYFPPEVNAPATRTYEHCARWVRQGHKVTVVTCNPNHPHGSLYPGHDNRFWQEHNVDGIRVIRLWTFLSANKGFGLRTLNYIGFMLLSVLCCFRFGKHDVVISTSPHFFNGLAGYMVARLRRLPWVLEIRDLWPESIVAVGAMKEGVLTRLLYWLEGFCYRACDLIVPVTDSFKDYMVAKGIPPEKICVIKNGVDCSLFSSSISADTAQLDELFAQHGLDGKFIAAYVGTHGMAHHLETVLEAAEQLRARRDIAFLLVGDGAERERLVSLAQHKQLRNVAIVGQLPKNLMPALWQRVQVSLILLRKSDTFKSVIPSKIFESLAMNKPIILGVEGESAALVLASGGGVCIAPEAADQLAHQVLKLADNPDYYRQLSSGGREFVSTHYDRDALALRMAGRMAQLSAPEASLSVSRSGSID